MPVTHIVLLRWASDDPVPGSAVREAIRGLPAVIPSIRDLREGPSSSPEGLEGGYEYGFVMTFDDEAARDAYLVHPAHLPVAEQIGRASAAVLVYDV